MQRFLIKNISRVSDISYYNISRGYLEYILRYNLSNCNFRIGIWAIQVFDY